MTEFPKFKDLTFLTSLVVIDDKIFKLQKSLFDFQMNLKKEKYRGSQNIQKSHHFVFIKRQLVHLKHKRSNILKQQLKK